VRRPIFFIISKLIFFFRLGFASLGEKKSDPIHIEMNTFLSEKIQNLLVVPHQHNTEMEKLAFGSSISPVSRCPGMVVCVRTNWRATPSGRVE
jgi:hypothetical protein